MFAIRDKKTGEWLYGTNYDLCPRAQRVSNNKAVTFESPEEAELEYRLRKCNAEYEIVKVKLIVVENDMNDMKCTECNRMKLMSPLARLLKDNPNMKPLIQ